MIQEGRQTSEIALTRLADLPITRFNRSRLLVNGEETFRSIFDDIESAKEYILVQFYIVKDDVLGRELKAKLIQKAKEDINVYFLYDEIGSYTLPGAYLQEMQDRGFFQNRPVELTDYTQRSFCFKLAVRSARLLAPIL